MCTHFVLKMGMQATFLHFSATKNLVLQYRIFPVKVPSLFRTDNTHTSEPFSSKCSFRRFSDTIAPTSHGTRFPNSLELEKMAFSHRLSMEEISSASRIKIYSSPVKNTSNIQHYNQDRSFFSHHIFFAFLQALASTSWCDTR